MTEIDKAYYIREAELAVLLALAGQNELYGYPLHGISSMGRAGIDRTLFDMAGDRMLSVKDGKMLISSEWQEIVRGITRAKVLIVSAESGQEHSERFIYVSDRPVVLHTQMHKGGIIRIERWKHSDIVQQIMQYGVYPDSILQNAENMKKEENRPNVMPSLQNMATRLFNSPLSEALGEKGVISALGCYRIRQHRKIEQVVIYNQEIEDYVMVSDGEESSVYLYSDKKLTELISKWIGVE